MDENPYASPQVKLGLLDHTEDDDGSIVAAILRILWLLAWLAITTVLSAAGAFITLVFATAWRGPLLASALDEFLLYWAAWFTLGFISRLLFLWFRRLRTERAT